MSNIKKSKIIAMVILVGVIVAITLIYFSSQVDGAKRAYVVDNGPKIDYDSYYGIFAKSTGAEKAVKNISEEETPYLYLFRTTKVYTDVLGYSQENAEREALNQYYEQRAFLWYGNENGFTVTDEEVNDYIASVVDDYPGADNYEELQAACKKNGVTLEDVAYMNFDVYKVQLIRDRIYESEKEKHPELNTTETFRQYWDTFKENIVSEYRQTDDFAAVEKACKSCTALIGTDEEADASALSERNIFISRSES